MRLSLGLCQGKQNRMGTNVAFSICSALSARVSVCLSGILCPTVLMLVLGGFVVQLGMARQALKTMVGIKKGIALSSRAHMVRRPTAVGFSGVLTCVARASIMSTFDKVDVF